MNGACIKTIIFNIFHAMITHYAKSMVIFQDHLDMSKKMPQSLEVKQFLSCFRRIFPVADLGILSVKTTFRTFLYGATCQEKKKSLKCENHSNSNRHYDIDSSSHIDSNILEFHVCLIEKNLLSNVIDHML